MKILKLEDRIVLDGAMVDEVVDASAEPEVASVTIESEVVAVGEDGEYLAEQNANAELESKSVKVVLIANDLENQNHLVETFGDSNFVIIPFDVENDTPAVVIEKMADLKLERQVEIEEVSLLSHGKVGQFQFGNQSIQAENLSMLGDFKQILNNDGKFKIYSCETSAGSEGIKFINQISKVTGVNVFASDDITGAKGDWVLENSSNSAVLKHSGLNIRFIEKLNAYQGSLAVETPVTGGNTPDLWLRASDLSADYADGADITQWKDVNFDDGNAVSVTATKTPLYEATGINNLPSVRFEKRSAFEGDYFVANGLTDTTTGNGFTMFVVAELHDDYGFNKYIWTPDNGSDIYFINNASNDTASYLNNGSAANGSNTESVSEDTPFLGSLNGKDSSNIINFLNDTANNTEIAANFSNTSTTTYISSKGGVVPWDGFISEFIFYEKFLDPIEHAKVENYLADKYGLTMDKYDYDDAGNVHNASDGLAGFGQFDGKASVGDGTRGNSYVGNASGILDIEGASDLDDYEFLMYNHDSANTTAWGTTDSPDLTYRIAREWRIDETGDVGTMDVRFDVSGLDANPTGYTEYVLMIDKDGNFHNSTGSANEMTQVVHLSETTGNYRWANDVNLEAGDYITLGIQQSVPPVITLSQNSINVTEGDAATLLDGSISITDADSASAPDMNGGKLELDFVSNGDSGDRLFLETGGSITVTGTTISIGGTDIGTITSDGVGTNKLIVTFNSDATVANMTSVAQQVKYQHVNDNPTGGAKVLRIIARDGEGGTSSEMPFTVNMTAVNDAPVVSLPSNGTAISFTEDGSKVAIDSAATVTDADSANLDTGALTVNVTNAQTDDRITIEAGGNVTVAGSAVSVSGTQIGTFTGGSGTTDLVITWDSDATPSNIQEVVRQIHFSNVSENPNTGTTRTVNLTLTDGDGGTSSVVSRSANVSATNDAPSLAMPANATDINFTEGGVAQQVDTGTTVSDVDSSDLNSGTMTVSLSNSDSGDQITVVAGGNVTLSGSDIKVSGTTVGTISGTDTGSNGNNLVITWDSNSTPSNVQEVLRQLYYQNTSDNPNTATKTLSFTLTDGDGGSSSTITKDINTTATNDAPVVALPNNGTAISFSEDGSAVQIDSGATVSDADSTNFDTGTLTVNVTNATANDRITIEAGGNVTVSGNAISVSGTQVGTFTGGSGTTDMVITWDDDATPSAVQEVVRQISYSNVSDTPDTGTTRTVNLTLTDGDGGTSTVASRNAGVTATNDAPVLAMPNNGTAINFTEGSSAVQIDSGATVSDADSTNFDTGTLTVNVTNATANDRITVEAGGNVTVSGNAILVSGTQVGTFTGGSGTTDFVITWDDDATPSAVQEVVRQLSYSNVSDNPDAVTTRTINVTLTDGDGGTSSVVSRNAGVTATNDVPVVSLPNNGTAISFSEDGSAVQIDSGATVSDADSTNFDTGTLTVNVTNATANDRITVEAGGNVTVSGNAISVSGTQVGTFTGGSGTTDMVITWDDDATPSAVQEVVRQISYSNVSDTPDTGTTRTVNLTLTDGDGGTSAVASRNAGVTATNDAPVLAMPNNGTAINFTEGSSAVQIDSGATVSDADSTNFDTGTLTVNVTNATASDRVTVEAGGNVTVSGNAILVSGTQVGTFTGGSGTTDFVITWDDDATPSAVQEVVRQLSYSNVSDNPDAATTRTINVTLTDGDGGTSSVVSRNAGVTATNDVPVVSLPNNGTAISFSEDGSAVQIDSGATVSDADSTNFDTGTLTVNVTNATANDRITVEAGGNVTVSGNAISVSGTQVGTFTGGSGTTDMVITWDDDATPSAVQEVVRQISYSNVSDTPDTGTTRTVNLTLTDGDGGTSAVASRNAGVTATNDAPVLAMPNNGTAINFTEGSSAVQIDSGATVSDADSTNFDTGTLTVNVTNATASDRVTVEAGGNVTVSGNAILVSGTQVGTFTGGSGTTDFVITWDDDATPSAVQEVVRQLSYSNVSDNPDAVTTRTINVTLTDGDGGTSSVVSRNAGVTATNDVPVVSLPNNGTAISFSEDGSAVQIDSGATVTDADSANFDGGKVTYSLTNSDSGDKLTVVAGGTAPNNVTISGSTISVNGTAVGTIDGTLNGDGTSLEIDWNSSATPAAVQAVLRQVQYQNTSDNPTAGTKVLSVSVTDGDGGTSSTVTKNINVTASNDAPVLALPASGTDIDFDENDAAVSIDTGATVTDADSANFDGGKVTYSLTNSDSGDKLTVVAGGTAPNNVTISGSTISVNGTAVGTIDGTLNGDGTSLEIDWNSSATPAAVQAVLRQVQYQNTSDNPTAGTKVLSVSVTDGDGGTSSTVTKNINVTASNDAPVLALPASGTDIDFDENDAAVSIDTGATVTDADSANFDGGKVTYSLTNSDSGDKLTVVAGGTAPNNVTISGSTISVNGTAVGTIDGTLNGDGTSLEIDWNSSATPAAVQAVLRQVQYQNTSDNPTAGTKVMSVSVTDGDGGTSSTVTKNINVTASNDAPVVAMPNNGTAINFTEDSSPVQIDSGATVSDADSTNFDTGTLTVDVTNATVDDRVTVEAGGNVTVSGNAISVNGTQVGTFTGGSGATDFVITWDSNATPSAVQEVVRQISYSNVSNTPDTGTTRSINVTLTDGDGGTSAVVSRNAGVTASNDAPVVAMPNNGTAINFTEDSSPVQIDSGATVSDADSTNFDTGTLTVDVTNATVDDRVTVEAGGNVTVSGNAISVNGTQVGTFTGGSGATDFVITWDSNATPSAVQEVVRQISYSNVSNTPDTGTTRSINVTLTDGDGGTSAVVSRNAGVTASNDAPVVAMPNNGTAINFTEDSSPVQIDSGATVSDADSTNFDTGTLTVDVTNATVDDRVTVEAGGNVTVSGNAISVNGTQVGTFTGGSGATDFVITWDSNATPSAVQEVVRQISYSNVSNTPDTGTTRSINVTLTDGDGGTSAVVSRNAGVTASNDAPVVAMPNNGTAINFTEDSSPVQIDSGATVSDADSINFDTGTLTVDVTNATVDDRVTVEAGGNVTVSGNAISVNGTQVGTFTGGSGTTDFVITWDSNATPSAVQEVVRQISYSNVSDNPDAATTRTINVTLTDGDGGTSSVVSRNAGVTAMNDAPVVNVPSSGTDLAYTEGVTGIAPVDTGITVSDADSVNFDGGELTVQLTNNGDAGDQILFQDATNNVVVSGGNVTVGGVTIGTITGGDATNPMVVNFNSNATSANVQTLMQSLHYNNTSDNPNAGQKTWDIILKDGDGGTSSTVSKNIFMTAVSDHPIVTMPNDGETINLTEGDPARLLEPAMNITVSDTDTPVFDGGDLTVSVGNNDSGDRLTISDQPSLGVTVVGNNVFVNGTQVGTVTSDGSGSNPLTVTFNGNANHDNVAKVTNAVQYQNVSDDPNTGAKAINYVVKDGEGGISTAVSKNVSITAINDPATLSLPNASTPLAFPEDSAAQIIDTGFTVTDADSDDLADGVLTVGISNADSGDKITVTDGGNVTVTGNQISVNGTVVGEIISDGSGGNDLQIRFNNNATPALVSEVGQQITYQNTSDNPNTNTKTLSFQITDGDGGTSSSVTKDVNITASNDNPTIANNTGIPVNEGESVAITPTMLNMDDPDNSDPDLTYTLTSVPSVGNILLNGTALGVGDTFTQDDINNGRVSFNHNGDEPVSPPDGFTFTGSDGAGGSLPATNVVINTTAVNDNPTIGTLNPLTVNEGGTTNITNSHINITDAEGTPASNLTFIVNSGPDHGQILLNGVPLTPGQTFTQDDINQGRISYVHDGSENPNDGFTFSVSDGTGSSGATYTFPIIAVDDPAVLGNANDVSANEGELTTITNSDLSVDDPDTPATDIVFTLESLPANGTIELNGVVLNVNDTFTQDDIDNGRIKYNHDGSETTSDQITFSATDGTTAGTIASTNLNFNINKVNDLPKVSSLNPAAVDEGAVVVLNRDQLDASDAETKNPVDLVYTLNVAPVAGDVFLNGVKLEAGQTFTQDDVDNGRVSYQHSGVETLTGKLDLSVSDGSGGSAPVIMPISITPVNDAPALTIGDQMRVDQNENAVLGLDHFSVSDVDTSDSEIKFSVNGLSNGDIYLNGTLLPLGSTFTLADLKSGFVEYSHDSDKVDDVSLQFSLLDGDLREDFSISLGVDFTLDSLKILEDAPSEVIDSATPVSLGDLSQLSESIISVVRPEAVNGAVSLLNETVSVGGENVSVSLESVAININEGLDLNSRANMLIENGIPETKNNSPENLVGNNEQVVEKRFATAVDPDGYFTKAKQIDLAAGIVGVPDGDTQGLFNSDSSFARAPENESFLNQGQSSDLSIDVNVAGFDSATNTDSFLFGVNEFAGTKESPHRIGSSNFDDLGGDIANPDDDEEENVNEEGN